jgi:DnaJ-class molecular chaperone
MPDVSGRGKGDLLVTVRGTTPRRLTREQRRLLEELHATLAPDATVDEDKGLFDKVKDIFG